VQTQNLIHGYALSRPDTMSLTILILDTETNGLPKNRYAPISEPGVFPAILQLSWSIYKVEGRSLTTISNRDIGIALDPSVPWDAGAAKIHGIPERAARSGTPSTEALRDLRAALYSVDVVVAHNLAFDKMVLRAAGYATGVADLRSLWPPGIKEFCTMTATRDLVRIPATAKQAQYADLGRFKAPKLNELYTWLYGHVYDMSGSVLHTAASDTHCLAQCLSALLRRGHLEAVEGALRLSMAAITTSIA